MAEPHALPRVKLCGVRELDPLLALLGSDPVSGLGVEAVGFIAWESSPRRVSADDTAGLVPLVPGNVTPVAVFVDATPDDAADWIAESGAGAVQLCGNERPADWRGFTVPILRRVGVAPGAERELEAWSGIAWGFVLDAPDAPGGTGKEVDLAIAARLARLAPCLLAGGLDERNVAERIRAVRPQGVDASSRLEISPGVKDPARVEAFLAAVRAGFAAAEGGG